MKFFLDTANLDEIREAASMGVLGVTTNPSLIAKERADFGKRVVEICEIVQGPVSAEVTSTDTEEMCRQGRELAKAPPLGGGENADHQGGLKGDQMSGSG